MLTPKEVTIFVPFTYETVDRLIEGQAEIYGDEASYDIVRLVTSDGKRIWQSVEPKLWASVRSDLLFSQSVYDTLREAIYWEHHAS